MNEIAKDIVVLYHADCADGFSAAWAARKKFGDSAEYIPAHHGKEPPAGLIDKEIYLVDFTYPEEITRQLMAVNRRLTSIDHHAGSENSTKLTQDFLFDNNHSGAVLAWQYFHSNAPMPKFLLNIEDADLFRLVLADTQALLTYASMFLGDFNKWDEIVTEVENEASKNKLLEKGNLLLQYQKSIRDNLMAQKQKVTFENREVYIVNGPRIFRSEVGHDLAELGNGVGIYWYQEKDRIHVSLRSMPEIDMSEIARKYGGNGHKNAAAFFFEADQPFPWKLIKENG